MKSSLKTPIALLACGLFVVGVHSLRSGDLQYSDLEKKIVVDKEPLPTGGVVSSYAPALSKVMPAVVTIFSSKKVATERNPEKEEMFRRMFPDIPEDFFDRQGGGKGAPNVEQGLGSGVIITEDGYILTNNHVVGDADEIKVALATDKKKQYPAKVIGADPQTDVALIKIDMQGLPHVAIADSASLRIGDVALAVGNPLGLEQTATIGIISAVGRSDLNIIDQGYENFIQTDAAINRGNSGGALVDASGRLIGIPTAIQSGFSGGNIGIGFAIPSSMALNIVQRLLDGGGVVKRGALGVLLRELDPAMAKALGREDSQGVLIAEVGDTTPAAKAGMKAGDLILAYDGKAVNSLAQLRLDISNSAPGTEMEFQIDRKGAAKIIKVKLGDLDQIKVGATKGSQQPSKGTDSKDLIEGVSIADLDEETRSSLQLDDSVQGVLVKSVEDDSTAAEAGLRPGMVITQIDQADTATMSDAEKVVKGFKGDVLLVQVYMNGRRDILAIPLKK